MILFIKGIVTHTLSNKTNLTLTLLIVSQELLNNGIAGKASPASTLNHIMNVSIIKSICKKRIIAPFRVQYVF